ncbi:MAG: TraR/DksA C4-type zinc finger protein [Pseudomonadota bacterium]
MKKEFGFTEGHMAGSSMGEKSEIIVPERSATTLKTPPATVATVEPRQQVLDRIEAALLRLDQGTFGRCLACGTKISMKRLDRNPAALLCQTCEPDVD